MTGVIDCNIMHAWASPLEIFSYLTPGWREYAIDHMPRPWHDHFLGLAPKPAGALTATPMSYDLAYRNPMGDFAPDSMPPGSTVSGSDYELMRRQYLKPAGITGALLCHGTGMLVPALGVPRQAVEFTRAINDWTIDRWLSDDRPELLGTILVPTQTPEIAAEEIRRVGRHARMAGVLLGANGLGKTFGHPAYDPVFAAANELGLPIVIRAGGDEMVEVATYPAAAGFPGTFSEYRALAPQALMTHVASLICQGVMSRYPSLKFMLLGGSVGWITPFLWRLDTDYKAFRRDVPWLKKSPSEVFHDYFVVGTDPFVFDAAAGRLAEYLRVDHRLEDVICFASGYPDREYAGPEAVKKMLPPEWAPRIFNGNAARVLRLPAVSAPMASQHIPAA